MPPVTLWTLVKPNARNSSAACWLRPPLRHRKASAVSFGSASSSARPLPSKVLKGSFTEAMARSSAGRTSTSSTSLARTFASASIGDSACTGLGALGLSIARPLPRMSSTQSMVMPSARRALARSNCTRTPLDSLAMALASNCASWKFGWNCALIDSASAAPGPASATAFCSISAAAGVMVIAGGVRSGASRPSSVASSPELVICSMMSLPPTSSPSMYSCGMVGQSP